VRQPQIAKKDSLKTPILGSRSFKDIDVGTPGKLVGSACYDSLRSKSVSICNHFRARLVDSSRNRTFSRWYPNLMHSYGGLVEPRGSKLALIKSSLMPNISYAGCPGLSILNDFGAMYC